MTYTPPGQEPQQPQQPAYSSPDQSSYAAPQASYATPQYGQNPYAGYAASTPRPKSDKKTFGLWSMILGLSGLLLPFFVNNLAAIVLGIFGLIRENSKGMSITGLVSGGVGLLIWAPIVWFVIVPFIAILALGAAYQY
ncbi:DUF4190 domain-containing protein [Agrococcus sp. SGAir0287]|uniref:DUF4190 domain-containing protein n=1 Tax=Agrococcus sp. SGAir0287 TaxID=2070347 RepID=UPI0010CD5F7B|nr:DUF4190 domain-containing protein [Agrococcus sp. SGAir0287]QCR18373.1 hypothetical protein C1N71_01985 [Agrococcus sp. SGAir0287]